MPLTPEEFAAADAARFASLVHEVVEGLIPAPGDAVANPDAPATPGTSTQYARADHAHGLPELTQGDPGKSAYQSWLDEGNEGSEADFVASMQGEQLPAAAEGQTLRYVGGAWTAADWPAAPPPPPPAPPAPPPPPPPPAPSGALPGDIVNAAGEVVPDAYATMAMQLMQTLGILYRYGQPPTLSGIEALPERPDSGYIDHGGGNNAYFAFGPENNNDPNLYMTIQGTTIGKPNSGVSIANAVAWLQVAAVDRETFMQRPQEPWQYRQLTPPDISAYESRNQVEYNDPADLPVFEFRGENGADSPSTRLSFILTQGSPTRPARVITSGTYTARNEAMAEFKLGFVPTCGAITAGAEYLLVPGWNVGTTRGEVAIVSCGSGPQGWQPFTGQPRDDWWHGWMDDMHPGFFDQGNVVFMKVIGYLQLPETLKAPTACAASTGLDPEAHIDYLNGSINSFALMDSPMSANLPKLREGGEHFHCYSKGGLLVVTSQSEERACWIDLAPLFQWTNTMYLEHNAETQAMGTGPTEWPYALTGPHAVGMPTIIRTDDLMGRPRTCWIAPTLNYWSKDDQRRQAPPNDMYWEADPHYARAVIATEDGEALIFSTGRYIPGRLPTTGAVPADIEQVGTVTNLGANVTHIAACKGYPGAPDPLNQSFFVVDRAGRAIRRVALDTPADGETTTATVSLEVQDSDLDPIGMCNADNYHSTLHVVSVADHTHSRIRNYRLAAAEYGGDTVWEPGPLIDPTKMAERCGDLLLPFKPTMIHASNVP